LKESFLDPSGEGGRQTVPKIQKGGRKLKVREILEKTKTYGEIIAFIMDLLSAGEKAKDGTLYFMGLRLLGYVTQLGEEEVELNG